MYRFLDVDYALLSHVTIAADNTFTVGKDYLNMKDVKGKWAVFKGLADENIDNVISAAADYKLFPTDAFSSTVLAPDDKDKKLVYVSQSSKIPRDVLRRSYKIVNNPDKKDCTIIIPYKKYTKTVSYNIAVYSPNSKALYLYECIKEFNEAERDGTFSDTNILDICERAKRDIRNDNKSLTDLEYIYHPNAQKGFVSFIFKCKEYQDIANDPYSTRDYVYDKNVVYDPVPSISIDTLELWSAMPTQNMLYKSINSSNWKDYPFTVCMFMCYTKRHLMYKIEPEFAYVYGALDMETFRNKGPKGWLENKTVTAQDWNLAQEWALKQLGMPKEGGFSDEDPRYNNYGNVLRTKTAIKPLYIEGEISGENLINLGAVCR